MNPELLSPRGEQAWTWLRRHMDRAQGFWLGFVFTDNLTTAETLATRAQANRKAKNQRFTLISPGTPDELSGLLDRIEDEAPSPLGCTWVAAVSLSEPGWEDAWGRFLQALNHRRDYLRDRLGGLVIVASPPVKAYAQQYSADLWSVRDLLVELPTGTVPALPKFSEFQYEYEAPQGGLSYGDVEAALADEVTELIALPPEQLATTSRDRAAQLTERALAAEAHQLAAILLMARAHSYSIAGDLAGALDLIRASLRLGEVDNAARFQLLDLATALAITANEFTEAVETGKEAVAVARLMDDPTSIASGLSKVGDAYVALGDRKTARTYFKESLAIRESLAEKRATESSRVEMAMTALRLGLAYGGDDADSARQHFSDAREGFDSLLKQAQSQVNRMGLARSLIGLGSVDLIKVGTVGAIKHFTEAVRVLKQEGFGQSPNNEERRLLAISHSALAITTTVQGDSQASAEHYGKALEIYRELDDDDSISRLQEGLSSISRPLPRELS